MAYSFDLTVVWALVIAFAVFAYIVMDGFDLGIGLLFAFRAPESLKKSPRMHLEPASRSLSGPSPPEG